MFRRDSHLFLTHHVDWAHGDWGRSVWCAYLLLGFSLGIIASTLVSNECTDRMVGGIEDGTLCEGMCVS